MAEKTKRIKISDCEENNCEKLNKKSLTYPDHILRKRLPLSFPKRNKDIYITNKTNFKVLILLT